MRTRTATALGLGCLATLTVAGPAQAGATRVEGLVGDPSGLSSSGSANGLLLHDDLNVFVNPALLHRYRGRVLIDVGLDTGAGPTSGLHVEPTGGVLWGPGQVVTFGLFLNRRAGRYGDQGPLLDQVRELTGADYGAAFEALVPSDDASPATRRLLPIDAMLSLSFGHVQLGIGFYGAFHRDTRTEYQPAFDESGRTTRTIGNTSYLDGSLGLRIEGERVSPEFWLRIAGGTDWVHVKSWPGFEADEDPEAAIRNDGIANAVGGSFGLRLPASRGPLTISPTLVVSYGQAQQCQQRCGSSSQDDQAKYYDVPRRRVGAVLGVGAEVRPSARLLVVATAGLQAGWAGWHRTTGARDALEVGFGGRDYSSRIEARPIVSVGAEAQLLSHLALRGSIRAAVGLSARISDERDYRYDRDDESWTDGVINTATSPDSGIGSLSATAGLSFPFPHAVIDLTVGGRFLEAQAGAAFFSRLGLTFLIPTTRNGADDETEVDPVGDSAADPADRDDHGLSPTGGELR